MTMGGNMRGRMMPRFVAIRVFVALLALSTALQVHAAAQEARIPATTRKVIYEKAGDGYRLKTVEAPVPKPGPGQVLLHVKVVSLNRGEIENMAQGEGRDRSGMIAASDAAGEVVALGEG